MKKRIPAAKVPSLSTTSIFCEDIREEKDERFSLIGTFSDNIEVPSFPGIMHKICIFTRVNFPPSKCPGNITIHIVDTNDNIVTSNVLENALIQFNNVEAIKRNLTSTGIISRIVAANFPVNAEGEVKVIVEADGKSYLSGLLNFFTAPASQGAPLQNKP